MGTTGDWLKDLTATRGAQAPVFYGVRTTGVFCRPGCPSRRPRPENVAFFQTAGAALDAGFRPCRRCRPLDRAGEGAAV
jgi:methylphosphotriester-DNA--protein-cysteine methyltransferase